MLTGRHAVMRMRAAIKARMTERMTRNENIDAEPELARTADSLRPSGDWCPCLGRGQSSS